MNDYFGLGLVASILILLAAFAYAALEDAKQWDEFSRTHECQLTSVESDSSVPVIGANGQMSLAVVPGKKGYKCNDGVTYYR